MEAARKRKSKNLVLTVVNGVAKWVDVNDATERFSGIRQERLRGHLVKKYTERYSGELE
jgi:hypothetical protein